MSASTFSRRPRISAVRPAEAESEAGRAAQLEARLRSSRNHSSPQAAALASCAPRRGPARASVSRGQGRPRPQ